MRLRSDSADATLRADIELLRTHNDALQRRSRAAIAAIEATLVEHGTSRHPLVDALLDVRNELRPSL